MSEPMDKREDIELPELSEIAKRNIVNLPGEPPDYYFAFCQRNTELKAAMISREEWRRCALDAEAANREKDAQLAALSEQLRSHINRNLASLRASVGGGEARRCMEGGWDAGLAEFKKAWPCPPYVAPPSLPTGKR